MSIIQSLENIDYTWTKPQTYLVCVPILSIVIQKIQLANTLPLIDNRPQDIVQRDASSRRFANICKWHLRGSMFQVISSIIALKLFGVPLFALFGILALYELGDTLIKSLRQITIYEFNNNNQIIRESTHSACNIF